MSRIKPAILSDILAIRFAGNAAHDIDSFRAIHRFVIDETTSENDALSALNHMLVDGMGCRPDTMDDLREYRRAVASGEL